jgi:acetylxylan esterase
MKLTFKAMGALATVFALVAAWLTFAPIASAATLTQITNFGTNPTNINMFVYVPDKVVAKPPILVVAHYCGGSASAMYTGTEFASLANQYGFIAIYPEVTRSSKCWDVSQPGALRHDGNSDPVGITSMVKYVAQHNNGDLSRVYVTGSSSGAMMTNVLLGDYPDVFKAGAAFAGVPFGCFATTNGSEWNSECSGGTRIQTPQQWGDMVRAAYPGYSGPRPRMQLWHGTTDDTLRYPNFGEEIKQWTNVSGLSQTPAFTDRPVSNWNRTRYGGTGDQAQVEAISVEGVGHNLPQSGMAARAIHFFGLDGSTPPPTTAPPTSAAPTKSPTSAPPTSAPPTSSPTTSVPPTVPPTSPGGNGPCRVTYSTNAWSTGLTASVHITNTGSSAINGWSLVFTLPSGQAITSGWNATYSPSSGQVTAKNVSYNGALAAGGSTDIGFQASHTGNTGKPSSFALNGSACAVA